MTNNRELAAAFGVAQVVWVLIGYITGAMVVIPTWAKYVDFVSDLLVLIFTPAVMSKARWTALGAMIAGVIRLIWLIEGFINMPVSADSIYFTILNFSGPIVASVLALLFTYFSFRAYQQK
jgi:hypothetical protein